MPQTVGLEIKRQKINKQITVRKRDKIKGGYIQMIAAHD